MDEEKLYTEYIEHIEAAREIAKKLGMVLLAMDSSGNVLHNAPKYSNIGGLFVMNILRQDNFKNIVENSLKVAATLENTAPQQIERVRKADEENAASSIVSSFLKKNGFK
ncbi:hypothetical protein [Prevotella intermedia]|uniref:Uncharacterized protein n=1 Tax=Prevotella intermedia TaxID=28131 RepID=A0A2G8I6L6_PREIN|nr:hypothetical protein [Prevotella intermedia]PIK19174.1 hypothetical protein CTI18_09395 [Prevotella intermedia]